MALLLVTSSVSVVRELLTDVDVFTAIQLDFHVNSVASHFRLNAAASNAQIQTATWCLIKKSELAS